MDKNQNQVNDIKRFRCPFLCGNCDMGSYGIGKCSEDDGGENVQGCAYLIGLSDVPYYDD